MSGQILIGAAPDGVQHLLLNKANRHGLIAGATGTGKTVTLLVLAQEFAAAGVPVFAADVKGDLSGVAAAGESKPFLAQRAKDIGQPEPEYAGSPVIFWDLHGEKGHPIRTTISEMGPLLLSRLLDLSEAQEGVLNIAFRVADDEGMLVLDLKDLRALLDYCARNAADIGRRYGNVAPASVGAIQRRLLTLEGEGGDHFFGEPALDIRDLMRTAVNGKGFVNVLAAEKLVQAPRLYATFLLWLLSELFEDLPEVGDADLPKLVFFFDEAHLLFKDAPPALVDKVTQVARLIRSKGVGVYFVTQSPGDIPDDVLGQLGNRIQHALRAYTPKERRNIRAVADSFRANPAFDTEDAVTDLKTGEALVSLLDGKGAPAIVTRTLIRPPACRLGPITDAERQAAMRDSPVARLYDTPVDRDSAYEILAARAQDATKEVLPAEKPARPHAATEAGSMVGSIARTV
ncbi:MAG: helicase HerA-like domain-containing protein, partial [Rhodospirillaceae bacterium]